MAKGVEKRAVRNETDTETRNSGVDSNDLSWLQGVNIYRGCNFLETPRDYRGPPMRTTTWLDEPQRKKNKKNSQNIGVKVHGYVDVNYYADVSFSTQCPRFISQHKSNQSFAKNT